MIDIALIIICEDDAGFLAEFQVDHIFVLGIVVLPDTDVVLSVTGKVILACALEEHSVDGLFEALTLSPAHKVAQAEAFVGKFDSPFTANLKDYALVSPADVSVSEIS